MRKFLQQVKANSRTCADDLRCILVAYQKRKLPIAQSVMIPVKFKNEYTALKFVGLNYITFPLIIAKRVAVNSNYIDIRAALLSVIPKWIARLKHLLSNQKRTNTTSVSLELMLRNYSAMQFRRSYFHRKYRPTFFR